MSEVSSQQAEAAKPSINLTDISQCVEVIKVCTDRGAWKPSELSAVGQLYDRLTRFLEQAGAAAEPTDTTNQQG